MLGETARKEKKIYQKYPISNVHKPSLASRTVISPNSVGRDPVNWFISENASKNTTKSVTIEINKMHEQAFELRIHK